MSTFMSTFRGRAASLAIVFFLGLTVVACQGRTAVADDSPHGETVVSTFHVEGMTCGGCEAGVKLKVKKLEGVERVEASHQEKTVEVAYDPTLVGAAQIVSAIEELGYDAALAVGGAQDEADSKS